jgi:aryl-alcohol dehydrogenase-like predicted oxidoreductase
MDNRRLGTTDLHVSLLGLGCNNFGQHMDLAAARGVVHAALDAGITLFDTADIYGGRGGSETILGELLGPRRKDIFLCTKFGLAMNEKARARDASTSYVATAIEASLKRLKTDWIDLYYLHRPDPDTPIAETLGALDKLIAQGKVRAIACSNMSREQVVEAQAVAQANGLRGFAVCQDHYNLLQRGIEHDLIPVMEAHKLALIPYFPLAGGMLTGKYTLGAPIPADTRFVHSRYTDRFLTDENFHIIERLRAFCAQRNRSLLELAFGWLLSKRLVGCVVAGASRPEQVEQNIKALAWRLDAAEMAEVDQLSRKRIDAQANAH